MKAPELSVPPLPCTRLWVAYSGGVDSTVLLQLLARHKGRDLRAMHVHHGLQAAADNWARHCRRCCQQLGVPLKILKVRVDPDHPEGPEAAAREARYVALRGLLKTGEVLATAHHQDDQAETLLLRLLRGSGVSGLAAMREVADFGPARLWRPLLAVPRARLLAHAQKHGLSWIEDPHNQDLRYARSYLRAEILPRLQRHWPQAIHSLTRTARLAAEASELLDELAAQDLLRVKADEEALSVDGLLRLPASRRNNLLRHWLGLRGHAMPAAGQLGRLEAEVLRARADAQPLLHLGDCEFRRYRDRLYVMAPLPDPPRGQTLHWRGSVLQLPAGCGRLRNAGRLRRPLRVGFAAGGESIRLRPDAPARTLRNLFQEKGVPAWVRQRVPLIHGDDGLLAVGDLWTCSAARDAGLRPRWIHELPGITAPSVP